MSLQTNTNVAPYFDDFDPKDNFYRVLFKPGFPVQARELTQSQSILQDQIEKFASRLMNEGDNIVPGEFSLSGNIPYVRCSTITNGAKAEEFVGYNLIGVTSGVRAKVQYATEETDDDDVTFYVVYEDSGSTSEYTTFLEQETLESDTPEKYTAKVGVTPISKPIDTPAIGTGSLFTVSEGVYFIDGFMVRNDEQVITLDKYGNRPSYKVGFIVTEEFINSSDDPSLLDNAQGYSNFAAPGADRLKINLTLAKRDFEAKDPNFITLASIRNGGIVGNVDRAVKWDWLYDILAKRTYDESGDYIVSDFPVEPMEYTNTEDLNGIFDADEETGEYPAIPRALDDTPLTFDQANANYVLRVDPGQAYVRGYSCGLQNPMYLYSKKARDENYLPDTFTQITEGYNITLTNVSGVADIQNISDSASCLAFDSILLYRSFIDGFVGQSATATGKPLNFGNEPWITYHIICDGPIGDLTQFGYIQENIVFQEGNSAVLSSQQDFKRGGSLGGANILIVNKITPRPSGVMSPRYLLPKQYVDTDEPFRGYNSTHKLGFLNSVYFTELAMVNNDGESQLGSADWEVGKLVFGVESETYATVERGSEPNVLVVSNIVGGFINGEKVMQITSAGTKISRILKPNEVVEFQFHEAGDLAAASTMDVFAIGSKLTLKRGTDYLYSPVAGKMITTEKGRQRLLNHPYPEGSDLNERINYTCVTDNGINGYAVQSPAKITNTLTKTKSAFSELSLTSSDTFSGDISIQNNVDAEVLDIADKSLFNGKAGTNFITCENFSGDPSEQLVFGDLITLVDDEGASVNRLVLFATKPVGYGENRSKSTIYLTTTLSNNVSGKTIQRVRVNTAGSQDQTLLYNLPVDVVASLESDPTNTNINYQVYREFVQTLYSGTTEFALTTVKDNERFLQNPLMVNAVIVRNLSGSSTEYTGRSVIIGSIEIDQDDRRKAVFKLRDGDALPVDAIVKILAPVVVTDAKAKRKVFRRHDENPPIEIKYDATIGNPLASIATPQRRVISLGIADVYKLHKITMGGPETDPDAIDVTNNYILDDGQRDNFYDISKIFLKQGRPPAVSDLYVYVDYFEHSAEGDFFSVDSYTHDEGVPYGMIPTYVPNNPTPDKIENPPGREVKLRDVVDFRPVINTADPYPSVVPTITPGTDAQSAVNFRDTTNQGNAFVPRLPIPATQFQCDLEYYLPRYDSLFLEKNGDFTLIMGDPDVSPKPVENISTGIRLYDIFLPAYTFSIEDIKIKKFNYRRYTMKDIAALDRRIDNVEELVTLSILEQSALNMSVRDAVTGLDRFKNGIVVDTFRNHQNGDVGSTQYRNAIDPKNTHLRAPHFKDQVEIEERNQTVGQREGNAYVNKNGILMLTYDHVEMVENRFATRSINLQPYSVFTYDGNVSLTPSVDTFEDTNRLPRLVIEDNSVFDAITNVTNAINRSGIGTVWGDWETSGTSVTSRTTSTEINRRQTDRNNFFTSLNVTETTESVRQARNQTTTSFNVNTSRVVNTSYGDRVVDVQLAKTMRSIPVLINAKRLKPNTRYYVFFDDIEVSDWMSVDALSTDFPDGKSYYVGQPNSQPKGFGHPIISDNDGVVRGLFLIPNGRAPVQGSVFQTINSVEYRTDGPSRSFSTGQRVFRLTSSKDNVKQIDRVEAFAETTFTSSGVLMDKQETVVSTRVPGVSSSQRTTGSQSRTQTSTSVTDVGTSVRVEERPQPEPRDPVAQTFVVDNTNSDGVFVTALDVFFETKDEVQPVEVYLTTTDGAVPTTTIIPHSTVTKQPNTKLRVMCELPDGAASSILKAGMSVVGQESGATGVLQFGTTFESASANPSKNVTNYVYNVILGNYLGDFQAGEQIVSPDLKGVDALPVFTIVQDEVDITRVDLDTMGADYGEGTVIEFSEPELPGGVTATAEVKVAPISTPQDFDYVEGHNGQVYEIVLTNPGSGYTRVPSVTINGVGGNATASVRTKPGREAVDMGVSTSDDATAATRFVFPTPVYLLGDTEYAFVVRCPTSLKYKVFCSKLGENIIGTETRVTEQPSIGSLFKSQNGVLWTEDQTTDITFVLHRAEFDTNIDAKVELRNAPLTKRRLELDPIETSSFDGSTSSEVFGINPRIVRINHENHGLNPGDLVIIEGVVGTGNSTTIGGIPLTELNTIHQVLSSDLNTFVIKVKTKATLTAQSGGYDVFCTYNRPYEVINMYSGIMQFGTTTLRSTHRAIHAAGLATVDISGEDEIKFNQFNAYRLDDPHPFVLTESFYYTGPRQIASYINEVLYSDGAHLQGGRSSETIIRMMTMNRKVSPVIDLERTNLNVIRNMIDNPHPDDLAYGASPVVVTYSELDHHNAGDVIDIGGEQTRIASVSNDTRSILLYKNPHATLNEGNLRIGGSEASVVDINKRSAIKFEPESSANGSVFAKWISKPFIFENVCDGLEIKLSAIFYTSDSIKVYFRPKSIGFDNDITSLPWIPFNETGLPDNVELIKPRSSDNVDPNIIQPGEWQSLTWSVQDLAKFDAVSVKIVMAVDNPAQAPLIDDLQLVASE